MRIALARHAVSGPARVRDAELAVRGVRPERVFEIAHLADRARAPDRAGAVENGDAGGVVAAVLEPAQAVDQYRDDVVVCDGAYDSTHERVLGLRADAGPLTGSVSRGRFIPGLRRLAELPLRSSAYEDPHDSWRIRHRRVPPRLRHDRRDRNRSLHRFHRIRPPDGAEAWSRVASTVFDSMITCTRLYLGVTASSAVVSSPRW